MRVTILLLLLLFTSLCTAQPRIDPMEALPQLSHMFYEDQATFRRELLDPTLLDFSIGSLRHINEYLDTVRQDPDVEVEMNWFRVVLRTGAYVGEVIRRNDGRTEWKWIDYDEAKLINRELFESLGRSAATLAVLYDGEESFVFPLAKVEKYLDNGEEDDLHFFATAVLDMVGEGKSNSPR